MFFFNKNHVYLPSRPIHETVDTFSIYGSLPEKPYLRIQSFEADGGQNGSYNFMVRKLMRYGREYGFDGVIIQDIRRSEVHKDDNSLFEVILEISSGEDIPNTYWTEIHHHLRGLGIIYAENLENYVKRKWVYPDSSAGQYATEIKLNLGGALIAVEGEQAYADLLYDFSIYHLLYERLHWRYQTDELNRIVKRVYKPDGFMRKKCQVTYNYTSKIEKITIKKERNKPNRISTMHCYYDIQGRLSSTFISSSDYGPLKQVMLYDAIGRKVGERWYKINHGQEEPFFRVTYELYSPEDFSEFLSAGH